MTLQHTPGPWSRNGDQTAIYGSSQLIAFVLGAGFLTPQQIQANADLIVAAPDLLKALSEMECAWCGQTIGGEPLYEGHECHCAEARAVVKKARGE